MDYGPFKRELIECNLNYSWGKLTCSLLRIDKSKIQRLGETLGGKEPPILNTKLILQVSKGLTYLQGRSEKEQTGASFCL